VFSDGTVTYPFGTEINVNSVNNGRKNDINTLMTETVEVC